MSAPDIDNPITALATACKPTPCCHVSGPIPVSIRTDVGDPADFLPKTDGAPLLKTSFHDILQKCLNLTSEQLLALCKVILLANPDVLEKLCHEGSIGEAFRRAMPPDVAAARNQPRSVKVAEVTDESEAAGNKSLTESVREPEIIAKNKVTIEKNEVPSNGPLNRLNSAQSDAPARSISTQSHRLNRSQSAQSNSYWKELARLNGYDPTSMHQMATTRDCDNFGQPPDSLPPIIQFQSTVVYAREDDDAIYVTLMRIGGMEYRSKVRFETRDGTAIAGKKYVGQSGEIVFEEGERTKTIQLGLVNDEAWDATTYFSVALVEKGLENARIGEYLWHCTVKILDDDAFPTNAVRDCAEDGTDIKRAIKGPVLLIQYFKMNLRNGIVRRGTIKTLFVDQFNNFYFIFGLFLELYMVDKILPMKENYTAPLLFIAVLRLIPYPFVHFMQYRQVFWRVGGSSRKTLQSNLLRKFLHYTDESREKVDESRLIMAISRDAEELVEWGYMKLNPLIANLTRLVYVLLYQALMPYLMGKPQQKSWTAYVVQMAPALVFPAVMLGFLRYRNVRTIKFLEAQKRCQNEMLHRIKDILENIDIIRDYQMKDACNALFDDTIAAFNLAFIYCSSVIVNNKRFAPTCSTLLVCFYTVWGGMLVAQQDGSLSLGTFLSTLQVYNAIGSMWGEIYNILLDMQNTFEALNTMVEYMNLPVDVESRMLRARRNIELSSELYATAIKDDRSKLPGVDPADLLCIEFKGLGFKYKHTGALTCDLRNITASLAQGAFYSLIGPPSEGKGTILKLLCEVILPYIPGVSDAQYTGAGDLTVPSHLRQLHVLAQPKFIEGTLLHNLRFGVAHDRLSSDGNIDRILSICRLLGVSESTILTIEKNDVVCNWSKTLSATEASLLHIARALIANPEVLCVHKPTLYLNNDMAPTVYEVLRQFVEHRGLCLEPGDFYMRRPRTCIVTSRSATLAGEADSAYFVSKAGGMQLMKRDEEGEFQLMRPDLVGKAPTTVVQW